MWIHLEALCPNDLASGSIFSPPVSSAECSGQLYQMQHWGLQELRQIKGVSDAMRRSLHTFSEHWDYSWSLSKTPQTAAVIQPTGHCFPSDLRRNTRLEIRLELEDACVQRRFFNKGFSCSHFKGLRYITCGWRLEERPDHWRCCLL